MNPFLYFIFTIIALVVLLSIATTVYIGSLLLLHLATTKDRKLLEEVCNDHLRRQV